MVGDSFRAVHTRLYDISLRDNDRNIQRFVAAGVDKIRTATPGPDLSKVREIFPGIKDSTLQRPSGEVEVLVGACDARLLPFGGIQSGDLRLERTLWGEGEVLRGSHHKVQTPPAPQLLPEALALAHGLTYMPPHGTWF